MYLKQAITMMIPRITKATMMIIQEAVLSSTAFTLTISAGGLTSSLVYVTVTF